MQTISQPAGLTLIITWTHFSYESKCIAHVHTLTHTHTHTQKKQKKHTHTSLATDHDQRKK